MRGASDASAEAWVLTTDAGRALLENVAGVAAPSPADLARWRERASPESVAAAVRLAGCRRRGASKFVRASAMWLDPTGLEQATTEAVARHKARRFPAGVVVDLCSGIGGDTVALAGSSTVIAVDASQAMARRTLWNAGVYGVADRVLAVRGRAQTVTRPPVAWVHVDPDRRPGGATRARRLAGYEPGMDFLRSLQRSAPGGAIKLGPASDFAAHFGGVGVEIEVVSLGGECKEATVWFGAAASCRRRATRLPEGVTWTDRDGPSTATAPVGPVGRFVFDPDPALIRAGLLDGFAAAHGLRRFAPGVDYLSGDDPVASAFLAAFAVVAVVPFDAKRLKHEARALGLDVREVKTRGVDASTDDLRARLRDPGGVPATLLVAGGHGPARAILARRQV